MHIKILHNYLSFILKYIIKPKYIYKKPQFNTIVLWDREVKSIFDEFIEPNKMTVLDLRGESLNIIAFFYAIFNYKKSLGFLGTYSLQFIKLAMPKFVLTWIDNDINFYKVKYYFKNIIFISVQNGYRLDKFIINSNLGLYCDYIMVMGLSEINKYKKSIKHKSILIGSIRNNRYYNKSSTIKGISFISQFRNNLTKKYYKAEIFTLNYLKTYILHNNLKLNIICSTDSKEEIAFYNEFNIEYQEIFVKDKFYESYANAINSEYIVFIDSQLGYEMLSRRKRVAAFSIRDYLSQPNIYFNRSGLSTFGYGDSTIDSFGKFWSNIASENELKRILDYTIMSSEKEWVKECSIIEHYMHYDPENKLFIRSLEKLNIPLKENIFKCSNNIPNKNENSHVVR